MKYSKRTQMAARKEKFEKGQKILKTQRTKT